MRSGSSTTAAATTGTGQRPPARLVAARHRPDAVVERAPLAPEGRAQDRLVERQACGRLGFGFARP